jgi:glycosyltransferase involved in cell wall biosynthesis
MMNLHEEGDILYVSTIDISRPSGPGVNEREFLNSLFRTFGLRAHALIPHPHHPCADACLERASFFTQPRRLGAVGLLRQQLALRRSIHRLLASRHFDLIVMRLGPLPWALYSSIARDKSIAYVVKTLGEIDGFARTNTCRRVLAEPLRWPNRWLHQKIVDRALALDACTEELLRTHQTMFGLSPERTILVENATNIERFAPEDATQARATLQLSQFDPLLGYVGGNPLERGGLEMLDLTARLGEDYPQIGAVIVGGDESKLLVRARELGIEHRVQLPGIVPYDNIPNYVNSFDVCFALDRTSRLTRVGNSYQKIRQYLACGKPIVTCVAEGSFLEREGLAESVDVDNLDSIEARVRGILSWDERTKRQHGDRAVAYACAKLSTEVTLKQRVDFWNEKLCETGNSQIEVQKRSTDFSE